MGAGLRYSPLGFDRVNNSLTHGSKMEAGTGITSGSGTVWRHSVTRQDGIITTKIFIDLTGLYDGGTNGDIIGKQGGSPNCHIGQITTKLNGTIIGGRVECLESPATGNADIDLYACDESNLAQDVGIASAGITETQLVNAGAHSAGTTDILTALPTDGQYLYLVAATRSGGTYSAGRLMIIFWGYVE